MFLAPIDLERTGVLTLKTVSKSVHKERNQKYFVSKPFSAELTNRCVLKSIISLCRMITGSYHNMILLKVDSQ